jgi:uncharacterized protein
VNSVVMRAIQETDLASVCALNHADVQFTSPMDQPRLRQLLQLACFARVALVNGVVAGFIIAMPAEAPYENHNFAWFKQRYSDFIYIDRIVIGLAYRKLKLATALYSALLESARCEGKRHLTCEYNLTPLNAASARFHERFGFREVGCQNTVVGAKRVAMQLMDIAGHGAP